MYEISNLKGVRSEESEELSFCLFCFIVWAAKWRRVLQRNKSCRSTKVGNIFMVVVCVPTG